MSVLREAPPTAPATAKWTASLDRDGMDGRWDGPEGPVRLSGRDGTPLVGRQWSPPGGSRGTVLVVHGLKDHGGRYEALARALAAEGFAVRAVDLRGHGRSGGPRQWIGAFPDAVDDLDRVAGWSEGGGPAGPTFVVAHSLGGAIALRWVIERAPVLAGLVTSGAAIRPPADVGAGARGITRLLGRLAPRLPLLRLPFEDFSRDPEVVADLARDPLIEAGPAPARTAAELLRSMAWTLPRLAGVRAPLLALHGTEDRLTDPAGSQQLVERAASQDKTLRTYPGLFHDLLHEPERDVVQGDVVRWILDRSG